MRGYENCIGRVFADRYEVINVVGSGGSAVVFGGYDIKEDRTVAIKMLHSDSENSDEAIKRFKQEAELLTKFSHPGIVKIYDTHLDSFPLYFVMEYVEGITLKKHILSKGAMPENEIYLIATQALSALAEVHSKGVVHSDVKPQNIVVLSDGSIRLMDFGISKAAKKHEIIDLDTFHEEHGDMAVGTVHYVSPEQAEAKELDHRSDLYSLGVTIYEMATGIPPFFGEEASKIAALHVNEPPIAPSVVNPSVSPEIEEIILKAMEKEREDRYQSAEKMLEAMNRIGKPHNESPLTFKEKVVDFFRCFSIPSGIAGALCALLVTIVVGLGVLSTCIVNERAANAHVKIPDLRGMTLSEVESLGLDREVYEINTEYKSDRSHSGVIISQTPSAGKVYKRADGKKYEINVTVAYKHLPSALPNVVAMRLEDAVSYLESYGINVTVITAPHDFIPEGSVCESLPAAGEPCTKDVTLVCSGGAQ
jgi:serine/threonine-protein kinase